MEICAHFIKYLYLVTRNHLCSRCATPINITNAVRTRNHFLFFDSVDAKFRHSIWIIDEWETKRKNVNCDKQSVYFAACISLNGIKWKISEYNSAENIIFSMESSDSDAISIIMHSCDHRWSHLDACTIIADLFSMFIAGKKCFNLSAPIEWVHSPHSPRNHVFKPNWMLFWTISMVIALIWTKVHILIIIICPCQPNTKSSVAHVSNTLAEWKWISRSCVSLC